MVPETTTATSESPFVARAAFDDARPPALVVACSDGHLQQCLDEFLAARFSIERYDRLYAPGGPGALAASGSEFSRAGQFRREFEFLIQAHAIETVILIFHGPAPDGPSHACCGDYRRKLRGKDAAAIRAQQEEDLKTIVRECRSLSRLKRFLIYRCEVRADEKVQFAPLPCPAIPYTPAH